MTTTTVHLVGSGPGDPGLCTLRVKALMEQADCVIYDYLAGKRLLAWCKPDAELVYVGKKGGDHTLPQGGINQLLIDKARELDGLRPDATIVRLKGGDPYVFGRGGEEAQELVAAGVPFTVVPGVTSGVAAPAYAGIPVTHRDHTSSVTFITGHEDPTKDESAHNWHALATLGSTLVFYMGVKNLPDISRRLIAEGMDAATPAAIIRWGTTCQQQHLVATIETLPDAAVAAGFKAPSIIVVGHVCSLAGELDFFGQKPLLGHHVVVTRAREQASGLLAQLEEHGACVHEFPTIAIEPMPDQQAVQTGLDELLSYHWVIFTSVNGVHRFFAALEQSGHDARALGGKQVAAIGPATAQALTEYGIRADFIPEKYVAEHVVSGLLERGVKGKSILIPRAEVAREVLPEQLGEAGAAVTILPVYRTTLAHNDASELSELIASGAPVAVTFTSSSTVENFFELLDHDLIRTHRDTLTLASIGPVTTETLARFGHTPDVMPDDYTIPGLRDALIAHIGAKGSA